MCGKIHEREKELQKKKNVYMKNFNNRHNLIEFELVVFAIGFLMLEEIQLTGGVRQERNWNECEWDLGSWRLMVHLAIVEWNILELLEQGHLPYLTRHLIQLYPLR